jgi:uncharacterized protein YndB with AHSA1/START domain
MTTATNNVTATVQVHRVYIKAAPHAVWEAITKPEWSERYGYGGRVDYDLRQGGAYRVEASEEMKKSGEEMGFPTPDVIVDGEVIEADPPRKLVQTWRMLMDPAMEAEGFTRVTYELEEISSGVTRLTLTHDLTGAPQLASMVAGEHEAQGAGGGWSWVLSDLKSLLETGKPLAG